MADKTRKRYDVFLSFRGEDTRLSFVDHLSAELDRNEFVMFKDDRSLKKGKTIEPELFKAIEESRVAIVIISPNYANSTWCLDELVKILHCRMHMKLTVWPVFHQVQPSDVRAINGMFFKAVEKHGPRHPQKIGIWKASLLEVSHIVGWVTHNRQEASIVKNMVEILVDVRKRRRMTHLYKRIDNLLEEGKESASDFVDDFEEGIDDLGAAFTTILEFVFEEEEVEKDESSKSSNDDLIDEVITGLQNFWK